MHPKPDLSLLTNMGISIQMKPGMTTWLVMALAIHAAIAWTVQHYHASHNTVVVTRTLPLHLVPRAKGVDSQPAPTPAPPVQPTASKPKATPAPAHPLQKKQQPKVQKKPQPQKEPEPLAKPQAVAAPAPSKPAPTLDHEATTAKPPLTEPQVAEPSTPATPPANPHDETLSSNYQTLVRSGIEQNRYYPRRDRRKRNQGRSIVEFTIKQDGSISGIHIVSSSGHASLDRATIQAVKNIDGDYPIPDALGRDSWTFSIPVIYRLR